MPMAALKHKGEVIHQHSRGNKCKQICCYNYKEVLEDNENINK